MRALLSATGWPEELHGEALAVSYCESKFSPEAKGDSGQSLGLFQLNVLWFSYAGEDSAKWTDPAVNARTALATYRYDIAKGQAPWMQWGCKP